MLKHRRWMWEKCLHYLYLPATLLFGSYISYYSTAASKSNHTDSAVFCTNNHKNLISAASIDSPLTRTTGTVSFSFLLLGLPPRLETGPTVSEQLSLHQLKKSNSAAVGRSLRMTVFFGSTTQNVQIHVLIETLSFHIQRCLQRDGKKTSVVSCVQIVATLDSFSHPQSFISNPQFPVTLPRHLFANKQYVLTCILHDWLDKREWFVSKHATTSGLPFILDPLP